MRFTIQPIYEIEYRGTIIPLMFSPHSPNPWLTPPPNPPPPPHPAE